jgi:hypothetical protein
VLQLHLAAPLELGRVATLAAAQGVKETHRRLDPKFCSKAAGGAHISGPVVPVTPLWNIMPTMATWPGGR